MRLNIFNASQGSPEYNHNEVNMLEKVVDMKLPILFDSNPLQACLTHFEIDDFDIDEYTKDVNMLLEPPNFGTTLSWTKNTNNYQLNQAL